MKIKCKLEIELEVSFDENDEENTAETVRFLVEEDLQDIGYSINSVEVVEGTEVIKFD